MKQAEMNLDAPVAGMSLTSELGGRPWQKPPQYNTVDEAVDYYVTRLNSDDASEQVVDVLEMGVTPSKLANIIQLGSVMEGVHSIDVGVLVTPVIMEFIKLIGDSSNVKYKSEEDEIDDKTKDDYLIRHYLNLNWKCKMQIMKILLHRILKCLCK